MALIVINFQNFKVKLTILVSFRPSRYGPPASTPLEAVSQHGHVLTPENIYIIFNLLYFVTAAIYNRAIDLKSSFVNQTGRLLSFITVKRESK
jgi:hypothetical protein